jgi:hypothetical protein
MKKIIRLTESDLINLVNRVIKEQSVVGAPNMGMTKKIPNNKKLANSNFKAEATVEDDMLMQFPVIQINNYEVVEMFLKDPISGKVLLVKNFGGPIYAENGKTKIYRDSSFNNITSKNWRTIATKYKIPVSDMMV